MNRVGIFNCPPVKINEHVEFVCGGISSIGDENYYKRVNGKVIKVDGIGVLVELPKGYKQIGKIRGWPMSNKLYWWVETYRKIEKELDIE